MIRIFHNPRCSKSRATLEQLQGQELEVVDYLRHPPTPAELDQLLKLLGLEPAQIARTGEERYEELGLGRKPPATRVAWLKVLSENPILIERPIVTDGKRAVIGRPPENVKRLLR
jgi:arsenate reductase (glutaredoxin)